MACSSGSMPINVEPTKNKCDLTCKYTFNYGTSSLIVSNKANHLALSYDGTSEIQYNGDDYRVQECRLSI